MPSSSNLSSGSSCNCSHSRATARIHDISHGPLYMNVACYDDSVNIQRPSAIRAAWTRKERFPLDRAVAGKEAPGLRPEDVCINLVEVVKKNGSLDPWTGAACLSQSTYRIYFCDIDSNAAG